MLSNAKTMFCASYCTPTKILNWNYNETYEKKTLNIFTDETF